MVNTFKRRLRGGVPQLENTKPHLRGNCERCLAGLYCARGAVEEETSSEEEYEDRQGDYDVYNNYDDESDW